MSGLWEDIKNAYFSYNGMGTNVFFLFVAIFYFLIINKKRQRNLLIYEIFGILFLVTPGIANGILNMGLNYTSQHLEFITNSYKISNEVMEIAEQLEFVEKPRVLAPEEVAG